jgi:hypothetical protein
VPGDGLEDAGAGLDDGEGPDQVSLPGRHRLSELEGLVVDSDERLLDGSLAEDCAGCREGETGEEGAELHARLETGGRANLTRREMLRISVVRISVI